MEPCYEYLGCKNENCLMHRIEDNSYCWEVEGTLCNHPGIVIVRKKVGRKKKDACALSGCLYYKAALDRNIV